MKKLRKLDFDKFEQMSNDEADALRGGITVTYKYSSGNYTILGYKLSYRIIEN
jgi:hypothetical protein